MSSRTPKRPIINLSEVVETILFQQTCNREPWNLFLTCFGTQHTCQKYSTQIYISLYVCLLHPFSRHLNICILLYFIASIVPSLQSPSTAEIIHRFVLLSNIYNYIPHENVQHKNIIYSYTYNKHHSSFHIFSLHVFSNLSYDTIENSGIATLYKFGLL